MHPSPSVEPSLPGGAEARVRTGLKGSPAVADVSSREEALMSQQTAPPPVPPPPVMGPQQEGKKAAWKHWWFWVIVVLVVLLVAAVAAGSPGDPSTPRSAAEPSPRAASTASPSPASTPTSPRWLMTPEEVAAGLPDRYMDALCPTIDILPREFLLRKFAQGYKKGGNVPGMPPARLVFEALERSCEQHP